MNDSFNEYLSSSSIATSTTLLPDFGSHHENYTKSVARGRNPKSIPRNSELWYHTKNSNERRDKIAKGHQFWGVVDHTAAAQSNNDGILRAGISTTSTTGNILEASTLTSDTQKGEKRPESKQREDGRVVNENFGRKNQNNFKILNSSRFDVKVNSLVFNMLHIIFPFVFSFGWMK